MKKEYHNITTKGTKKQKRRKPRYNNGRPKGIGRIEIVFETTDTAHEVGKKLWTNISTHFEVKKIVYQMPTVVQIWFLSPLNKEQQQQVRDILKSYSGEEDTKVTFW